ncbi:hypothetical protein [Dyadobacter sp. NIV53]|uniref:hypothetical protein n=1 Tax=Dyadobacter sp. NIV53 TaxID=2861765 RepID=UPI001C87A702|nr:hypothetical protein [Dyadobacter sp. NIV53]
MDTKDFIKSGILESHALGFSTEEEKEYIKYMISENEDISNYVTDLESEIKSYFNQNQVPPPPDVREVIQLRNIKSDIQKKKFVFNQTSKEKNENKNEYLDIEVNDTYIKVHKYWRPAFIAIFILSKIFLIAGLYYYFKTTSLTEEVVRLKTEIQQIK